MKKVTVMRSLRDKYGVSARELADAAGVSQQYISDLELGRYRERYDYRKSGEPLVQKAFETVAAARKEQAWQLSEDLANNRHRLLGFVEENNEL